VRELRILAVAATGDRRTYQKEWMMIRFIDIGKQIAVDVVTGEIDTFEGRL
jgi:hypothetical protein